MYIILYCAFFRLAIVQILGLSAFIPFYTLLYALHLATINNNPTTYCNAYFFRLSLPLVLLSYLLHSINDEGIFSTA